MNSRVWLFEAVEAKLGSQPESASGAQAAFDDAPGVPIHPLSASWFDPSFDPGSEPAVSFTIRFDQSVPRAARIEPPKPLPAYVPADAIAIYAPWHFYRDDFGAYIRQDQLLALASRMAIDIGVPFADLAPHVLRQIVLHEQAHFMFEIAAAELEDVAREWLYRSYTQHVGPWPPLTDGVVEEIWAAWRELEYAKRAARKLTELRAYPAAVDEDLRGLPPGYRDFELMRRHGLDVRAAVASLVIGSDTIVTGRWGGPTGREADNVPLYWVGAREVLAELGGFERTVSPPPIARFERWLGLIGATILPRGGKGSHRKVRLPNGRTKGYAVSAGELLRPEAKQIADALGLASAGELFTYVRDMRPLV
jgi:hypothetical protein